MRRFLATFLVLALISVTSLPAIGQSRRLDTRAGSTQPTPSFRGGQGQQPQTMPPGYSAPGYPGMPMQQGGQTGAGAPTMMMMLYSVHVLGEVQSPGTFKMPASTRLADAILMAGGLAENGSERRVELRRKGKKTRVVDLQKFQLFGSLKDNPYLMENDVVFIPLRKDVIQVVGAVRRPGTYELRNEKKLSQAVQLAGGYNAATAMDEPIRVVRFVDGEKKVEEVSTDKSALKGFGIRGGDVIVIPNVVTKETEFDYNVGAIPGDRVFYPSYEDRVFVLGGIRSPGAYPFSPYYTVNQYISLAGGITQRGKDKYKIITAAGVERKAGENDRVNPGDTIKIKERWMTPAGWLGFALSIASFGLSASATIIAIRR